MFSGAPQFFDRVLGWAATAFGGDGAGGGRGDSNVGVVLRALENRAALAAVELEESLRTLQATMVCGALAAMALLLAGGTATVIVAAVYWDTPHRVLSLVIVAVVELAAAAAGVWFVISRWRDHRILQQTRAQLAKDTACLREVFSPDQS